MVAVSISLTFRTAMLLVLFLGVFFTVNNQVDRAKTIEMNLKLQKIAEYIEGKIEYGFESITQYSSNNSQYLFLPSLDIPYTVELSCLNDLKIRVESELGKRYIISDFFNCSRITASGLVFSGYRCLLTKKINDTNYNITLVNSCAIV